MAEVITETDTDDLYRWDIINSYYDDDGELVVRETKYDTMPDDSFVFKYEYFEDGLLQRIEKIDNAWDGSFDLSPPGGQYSWLVHTVVFDYSDSFADYDSYAVTRYDSPLDPVDGEGPQLNDADQPISLQKVIGKVDGVVRKHVVEDVAFNESGEQNYDSDLKNWQSITKIYDAAASLSHLVKIFDNDSEKHIEHRDGMTANLFLDGEATLEGEVDDGQDNFDWFAKLEFTFSEPEGRRVTTKHDDDQDIHWRDYLDGNLTMAADEDNSGQHDWHARVRHYDESGSVIETVFYDNDEDFHAATELYGIFDVV